MSAKTKMEGAIKICRICIKDSNNKVIITCDKHHYYCEKCFNNIYSYLTSEYNSCISCLENTTKWIK